MKNEKHQTASEPFFKKKSLLSSDVFKKKKPQTIILLKTRKNRCVSVFFLIKLYIIDDVTHNLDFLFVSINIEHTGVFNFFFSFFFFFFRILFQTELQVLSRVIKKMILLLLLVLKINSGGKQMKILG